MSGLNDEVTEDQAQALFEIYLSGFVSGAVTFGLSFSDDEVRVERLAREMADSLLADAETKAQIGGLIYACLNDEEVESTVTEVRNVHRG